MFKKFLSRKLLTVFITGLADIAILTGNVDPEVKPLLTTLITSLGSLYVVVEGIRDIIIAIKNKFD